MRFANFSGLMLRFMMAVVLLVTAHNHAFAQQSDSLPTREVTPDIVAATWVLSTAGASLGMLGGALGGNLIYETTRCCGRGGEDPGLGNIVLGGFLGTVAGSALGAYLANRQYDVPFSKPLTAALGAITPALAIGYLAGRVSDGSGPLVGIAVGQGSLTTLFTLLSSYR